MHEFSIVQALLDQCEEHAQVNDASKITKVSIKVGVMSGVEPDLLTTAFETFKEGTVCNDALLDMKIQEVLLLCRSCAQTAPLQKGDYRCALCGSEEISIADGQDMMLMQLEME